MGRSPPLTLYPVAVVQDRYQGTYSHGEWFAVANADEPIEGLVRASWVLEHGPYRSDLDAQEFWENPPDWIAVGASADAAVDSLCLRHA